MQRDEPSRADRPLDGSARTPSRHVPAILGGVVGFLPGEPLGCGEEEEQFSPIAEGEPCQTVSGPSICTGNATFNGADEEFVNTTPSYLFGMIHMSHGDAHALSGYAMYFAACMGLCRWWKMAARDRKDSWTLFNPIAAGFFGNVCAFLWPHELTSFTGFSFGLVPLLIASIAVPLSSAWTPPPPAMPRKLRA